MAPNGPCVGDVLRPAQRVGTCFCVSKNRDKAKCAEGRAARRAAKRLRTVVRSAHRHKADNAHTYIFTTLTKNIQENID